MVDVIKVFIRTEWLADHNGHLCCIVSRMLDTFRLQGIINMPRVHGCTETFESFTAHGNHVVRYSSHDWSGTWCDICIEQTLMKSAKSEGGLSKGRMRHSDSGHKCWVLTLNHFSNESVKKHAPLHRDLGKTQMKRDAEAIDLALQWFEENNPFDPDRDKELLVSFSTGFRSTGDDPVNAERAAEIGREMQIKLDGQSVTSTMEVKSKIQALSSLRKIPKINEKKIHLDSLKLFNRLIIFAQRDMTVETSLAYELTPFPLSLFSNKDQKMNKANKAGFSKTSLKELTDPLDLTNQSCSTLEVDGGWLLYMVKWEQGQTWQEIANSYLSYVQCLGRHSQKTIVVFDGYSRSPKDHDHIRRTKKAKFLDNTNNKSELIHLLSSTFRKHNITVEQCDDDADTSIVREALATATDDSVEVRAEDADVLVMLVHHIQAPTIHSSSPSKGFYDVRRIAKLSERERCYLLFCHASWLFCAGDIDEHMDIFLDTQATKDAVIQAGTTIFQYIYHAPGTALGEIRHNMFSRKAAAGLIKPETLPPTEGAAAQHSLRAYLQTQDWILLQSMSLNPSDYGWTLGVHGYEPVPTLDPMAPEELLQFTSCNCNGDCSNRRCSCKRNGVKCISACGVCKGISCKNCGHDGAQWPGSVRLAGFTAQDIQWLHTQLTHPATPTVPLQPVPPLYPCLWARACKELSITSAAGEEGLLG
ncbi:hypothetical protein F7725_028272 [Dissostichus mawsoni]|uniref:Tesmin/TSO1-like CXC domain-containing protein n=1 Tax=Dissostichus mawsoni TaxID=36200 RepID=A0A7J5XFD6_DISMA|nr:hypothetical protein F7725_028272 [Dissostichus mawsoni]